MSHVSEYFYVLEAYGYLKPRKIPCLLEVALGLQDGWSLDETRLRITFKDIFDQSLYLEYELILESPTFCETIKDCFSYQCGERLFSNSIYKKLPISTPRTGASKILIFSLTIYWYIHSCIILV